MGDFLKTTDFRMDLIADFTISRNHVEATPYTSGTQFRAKAF